MENKNKLLEDIIKNKPKNIVLYFYNTKRIEFDLSYLPKKDWQALIRMLESLESRSKRFELENKIKKLKKKLKQAEQELKSIGGDICC